MIRWLMNRLFCAILKRDERIKFECIFNISVILLWTIWSIIPLLGDRIVERRLCMRNPLNRFLSKFNRRQSLFSSLPTLERNTLLGIGMTSKTKNMMRAWRGLPRMKMWVFIQYAYKSSDWTRRMGRRWFQVWGAPWIRSYLFELQCSEETSSSRALLDASALLALSNREVVLYCGIAKMGLATAGKRWNYLESKWAPSRGCG